MSDSVTSLRTHVELPVSPPEPELTPQEMIRRAIALRPLLKAQSADTEQRTYPTDEIHQACADAGIYRCYVPRRYGGYQFGAPTFMRVVQELSRGDVNAGWCIALAAAHALQVASWWPAPAQDEIFGDGDFRAASVAAPIGPAKRDGGHWDLTGRVAYCSGIPLSTHYMGQALIAGDDGAPTERMLLFVAPKSEFEILDDWGRLTGLKGTGSNTITFDHGRIPAHWTVEDAFMVDFDVERLGTPGVKLHDDPMYGGRALGCFTMTLTAVAVGGAYAALDEYEEMLNTKMTPLPPMRPRREDETFHRWYGSALAKIATAEAALYNAADQHMEACRRAAEDGITYTYGEDMRIGCIAREAAIQAWEVFQSEIFRTAGSSAATDGSRFERIYRDLSMLNSHRNTVLRDWAFGELARETLGLPRLGPGNVQKPAYGA
ncbi:MAG: acyl-CoA dehydrogenase family protein [Solirubrobacterales bacterium]|nr:acyl-CoA dehydrogenase family protein [Solirubrobacterales bacterium]MBV9716003.1 acyl-CoA dehydrogenase family protein [Solirubrobacterales bacterium]